MKSSQPQSPRPGVSASSENLHEISTVSHPTQGDIDRKRLPSGSFNDQYLVREVITAAMKRSGKSRAQLADEMSFLVGTVVTERMLNAFAAESREDCKFPLQYARALAEVTGDIRVLICFVEKAGLLVITEEEGKLLELGRQILAEKKAQAEIARLKSEIDGGTL
jgi:hypothetical protein